MRISDILTICLRNLTRRKVRTALTVIGVVIGVCAIILMISLGIGAKASMEEMLAQWGDLTIITVYNYGNNEVKLDDAAVAGMQAIGGVDIATPYYNSMYGFNLKNKNGRYQTYAQLIGIYPEALAKLGYTLTDGDYLSEGDREYSVVVGANVAYSFRDTKRKNGGYINRYDAMGNEKDPYVDMFKDKIILYGEPQKEGAKTLEVNINTVGKMEEDWNKGWETSECIFIDINELLSLEKQYVKLNDLPGQSSESRTYDEVRVKCLDVKGVADIQQTIKDMGYECSSMEDTREYFDQQLSQVQSMLGGLAAISLFVAAIGIANTMVMSIYERTREIGVMKVIGAEINNIRMMFLTESAMIGLIGGILGVAISFLLSYLMNNVSTFNDLLMNLGLSFGSGGRVSIIPWWLVGLAMAFSMMVGVVFGFIPANRAVKISALEAIRHD